VDSKSAQFDLGSKRIVFVKKEETFQPLEVIAGSQSDNWIEVLKGIDAAIV